MTHIRDSTSYHKNDQNDGVLCQSKLEVEEVTRGLMMGIEVANR